MSHPQEIKFALDAKLVALAQDGPVPVIRGVHSVVVEGDTVHVGYDLAPSGDILFWEFERPALVGRYEIDEFARWLAWSDLAPIVH